MNNAVIVYIFSKKSMDLKKNRKQNSPVAISTSVNMAGVSMGE